MASMSMAPSICRNWIAEGLFLRNLDKILKPEPDGLVKNAGQRRLAL